MHLVYKIQRFKIIYSSPIGARHDKPISIVERLCRSALPPGVCILTVTVDLLN